MEFKIVNKKNLKPARKFPSVPESKKLKFDDEELFATPKKKNLPVVIDRLPYAPKNPQKIEQHNKDLKAYDIAESLFGERTEEIMRLVEMDDRDGMISALYKQLMKMLVDLMPTIEKSVRATKGFRGVRSLNEMVSQIREMIADMQAVQDKGMMGQRLIARFVRPAFLDIAGQMMVNNERMISELLPHVDPKYRDEVRKNMQLSQRELARYIQSQYASIAENIVKGLT